MCNPSDLSTPAKLMEKGLKRVIVGLGVRGVQPHVNYLKIWNAGNSAIDIQG